MKPVKPTPTADQLAAVKAFAGKYGRNWKAALRFSWETGNYPFAPMANESALLQQLRNQFGPRWLNAFRLENRA